MSEDLLVIENSWPGTTIDGEPGIVTGTLTVVRDAGGGLALHVSTGPPGGRPEAFDYVEFPLSAEHARALSDVLGI